MKNNYCMKKIKFVQYLSFVGKIFFFFSRSEWSDTLYNFSLLLLVSQFDFFYFDVSKGYFEEEFGDYLDNSASFLFN